MLEGIVVADFSRVLAGPLCTQLLADAGARVIKIEDPARGDETRRWGPPFINNISTYFLSINRNKESIALDLKSERGQQIAQRIVERADVVIDNFLPAQKLLPPIPARAIHCTIRGFDSDTPEAATPGYDLLAQAGSGLMSITGDPDGDPLKSGIAVSDILTAHYAHGAILAALFRRERSGEGAKLEISLFGATVASMINVAQAALITNKEAQRYGNEHPSIVPYQLFHASDRPFAIGAGTDRHYQLLCTKVLRRTDLAQDPRFATNAKRVANRRALIRILEREFKKARASQWVTKCRKASIPASLVSGVREALRTPSGRALVGTIDHPAIGRYEAVRNPIRVNGSRRPLGTPPPTLGQHTEAIIAEMTGGEAPRNTRARTRSQPRGSRSR